MWISAMSNAPGSHRAELWGVYLQEMSRAPPHEEGGGVKSFYIFRIMYTFIMICWAGPRGDGDRPSTNNG